MLQIKLSLFKIFFNLYNLEKGLRDFNSSSFVADFYRELYQPNMYLNIYDQESTGGTPQWQLTTLDIIRVCDYYRWLRPNDSAHFYAVYRLMGPGIFDVYQNYFHLLYSAGIVHFEEDWGLGNPTIDLLSALLVKNSTTFYEGINRDFELINLFVVHNDARQLNSILHKLLRSLQASGVIWKDIVYIFDNLILELHFVDIVNHIQRNRSLGMIHNHTSYTCNLQHPDFDFDTLEDRLPSSIEDIILNSDLSAAYEMYMYMEHEFYLYVNVDYEEFFFDNFDLDYWVDLIRTFCYDTFVSLSANWPSLSIREFNLFGMADRWFLTRTMYEITEACFNFVTDVYRNLEYPLLWDHLVRIVGDKFTRFFSNSLFEYAKKPQDAYYRENPIKELTSELVSDGLKFINQKRLGIGEGVSKPAIIPTKKKSISGDNNNQVKEEIKRESNIRGDNNNQVKKEIKRESNIRGDNNNQVKKEIKRESNISGNTL
jgi:hypothetical protein